MKQIEPITMNYIGTSMNPTLKPGDKLEIIPYHGQGIRRGDVIALIPPGGDYKVWHQDPGGQQQSGG
jgi:molybdopterin converting factor small subunit